MKTIRNTKVRFSNLLENFFRSNGKFVPNVSQIYETLYFMIYSKDSFDML